MSLSRIAEQAEEGQREEQRSFYFALLRLGKEAEGDLACFVGNTERGGGDRERELQYCNDVGGTPTPYVAFRVLFWMLNIRTVNAVLRLEKV